MLALVLLSGVIVACIAWDVAVTIVNIFRNKKSL